MALLLEQMRGIEVQTPDELLAGLDDASYARALENTLDALQKLRSSDYFITRRLFRILTSELLASEVDDGGNADVTAVVLAAGSDAAAATSTTATAAAAATAGAGGGGQGSCKENADGSDANCAVPKAVGIESSDGDRSGVRGSRPPPRLDLDGTTVPRLTPPSNHDADDGNSEGCSVGVGVGVGGNLGGGDDVSTQLADSETFQDPLYAGRLILTRAELFHSPTRRCELLRSLLLLDSETVIQAIVDHHHQVSISELAAMLEDLEGGKWFSSFLQACVYAGLVLPEHFQRRLSATRNT